MKALVTLTALAIFLLWGCKPVSNGNHEFDSASKVKTGTPVSVMLTSYSTTLLANGTAFTRMRIAVTDSLNREITSASDSVCIYVTGDGKVTTTGAKEMAYHKDTSGATYSTFQLVDGVCHLLFVAGTTPDKVKVEAHVGKLWPGAHEIHTLPADFVFMKPVPIQRPQTSKKIDRVMGADIPFLPEIEARGGSFSENDTLVDALALLKKHGFNYIRLRIFVNPGHEKGYAPEKGFCDLNHTLRMAKRVQEAGMKFLLDFHYSDYWADPQQQYKPAIWAELDFEQLKDSLHVYTYGVLKEFELQGTPPDMVQIGNEINHGILWPEGHISQPEQLAGLLKEGVQAVREFNPEVPVMMHLALGGQHEEAVFWL
ncbi:MAG: arabinogalactan endo-1,4-beta-galactosidase, partial [Salinivirgaceae bacterium]|nr:arabinogalactan endo-1,4-beta-galactosidase [Salinivirgaceae bacterium]